MNYAVFSVNLINVDSNEIKQCLPVLPLAPVTRTVGRFAIEEACEALDVSLNLNIPQKPLKRVMMRRRIQGTDRCEH